jgi:hypothetical protein
MSQINMGKARAEAMRLAKEAAKQNYVANIDKDPTECFKVGDNINVNYDPTDKHPNRWGIVKEVVNGGYKLLFTSTKGSSCHGGVHKVYQRNDGTWIAETEYIEFITYNQIIINQ